MKNKYFNDQENYYPSMVDMMAGILFIMIILLMGFVIEEKVQKNESSQVNLEHKIDDLKNGLLKQLSDSLLKKDILNTVYPEDGSIIISTKDLFLEGGVELTKGASRTYGVLSKVLNQVIIQSEEGKKCLSNGYLDKIYVEVHSPDDSTVVSDSLLSWGRTIGFYGALLTADQNPVENQMIGLKNKNGHQILSINKFKNNWDVLNDYSLQNSKKNRLKKQAPNAYVVVRLSMSYPLDQ